MYENSPKDIDSSFYFKYKDILSSKKGGGYWLWKPYLIYETLKKIKNGDYLLYLDSAVVILNNCNKLIKYMHELDQDLLCFSTPFLERTYCKQSVLSKYKDDNYAFSFQIEATYILMKKTKRIMRFVKDWLNVCCESDNQIDDDEYFFPCLAHRHVQSIFSLTCKQYNYSPYINLSNRYIVTNLLECYNNSFLPDSPHDRTIKYLKQFQNCKFQLFFVVHHIGCSRFFLFSVIKRVVEAYLFFFNSKQIFESVYKKLI